MFEEMAENHLVYEVLQHRIANRDVCTNSLQEFRIRDVVRMVWGVVGEGVKRKVNARQGVLS
mgnify:CR=1 FL=1